MSLIHFFFLAFEMSTNAYPVTGHWPCICSSLGRCQQLAGAAATPWIAHLNLSGNLMRAADARWLANTFLKSDPGAAGGGAAGGSLLVSLVLDGNRLLQPEGRGELSGDDGAGATPNFEGMQKSDADWSGLEALGAIVANAQSSLRLLSVRNIEGFDPERTQNEYLGLEYDEEAFDLRSSTLAVSEDLTSSTFDVTVSTSWRRDVLTSARRRRRRT